MLNPGRTVVTRKFQPTTILPISQTSLAVICRGAAVGTISLSNLSHDPLRAEISSPELRIHFCLLPELSAIRLYALVYSIRRGCT